MEEEYNKDPSVTEELSMVNNQIQQSSSAVRNKDTCLPLKKATKKKQIGNSTSQNQMSSTCKSNELKEVKEEQVRLAKAQTNVPHPSSSVELLKQVKTGPRSEYGFPLQESLFCPCGLKMSGPLTLFQHMKSQHSSQDLEYLITKQTLSNFIKKYPSNTKSEFQAFESLEDNNFQTQISQIASRYNSEEYNCERQFPSPVLRGTYADLSFKFLNQFGKNEPQQLLLVQFFKCIKHFVEKRFGESMWEQESPKDILKLANHMYHYFRAAIRLLGKDFGPISRQHLLKLIYLLGRWMFINKWTNDRLVKLDPHEEEQDGQARPLKKEKVQKAEVKVKETEDYIKNQKKIQNKADDSFKVQK